MDKSGFLRKSTNPEKPVTVGNLFDDHKWR